MLKQKYSIHDVPNKLAQIDTDNDHYEDDDENEDEKPFSFYKWLVGSLYLVITVIQISSLFLFEISWLNDALTWVKSFINEDIVNTILASLSSGMMLLHGAVAGWAITKLITKLSSNVDNFIIWVKDNALARTVARAVGILLLVGLGIVFWQVSVPFGFYILAGALFELSYRLITLPSEKFNDFINWVSSSNRRRAVTWVLTILFLSGLALACWYVALPAFLVFIARAIIKITANLYKLEPPVLYGDTESPHSEEEESENPFTNNSYKTRSSTLSHRATISRLHSISPDVIIKLLNKVAAKIYANDIDAAESALETVYNLLATAANKSQIYQQRLIFNKPQNNTNEEITLAEWKKQLETELATKKSEPIIGYIIGSRTAAALVENIQTFLPEEKVSACKVMLVLHALALALKKTENVKVNKVVILDVYTAFVSAYTKSAQKKWIAACMAKLIYELPGNNPVRVVLLKLAASIKNTTSISSNSFDKVIMLRLCELKDSTDNYEEEELSSKIESPELSASVENKFQAIFSENETEFNQKVENFMEFLLADKSSITKKIKIWVEDILPSSSPLPSDFSLSLSVSISSASTIPLCSRMTMAAKIGAHPKYTEVLARYVAEAAKDSTKLEKYTNLAQAIMKQKVPMSDSIADNLWFELSQGLRPEPAIFSSVKDKFQAIFSENETKFNQEVESFMEFLLADKSSITEKIKIWVEDILPSFSPLSSDSSLSLSLSSISSVSTLSLRSRMTVAAKICAHPKYTEVLARYIAEAAKDSTKLEEYTNLARAIKRQKVPMSDSIADYLWFELSQGLRPEPAIFSLASKNLKTEETTWVESRRKPDKISPIHSHAALLTQGPVQATLTGEMKYPVFDYILNKNTPNSVSISPSPSGVVEV